MILTQETLELLFKAGYKYIRREPTGNPKRPWRYYYKESSQTRELKEGDVVKVKGEHIKILEVNKKNIVYLNENGEKKKVSVLNIYDQLFEEYKNAVSLKSLKNVLKFSKRNGRYNKEQVKRVVLKCLENRKWSDDSKKLLSDLISQNEFVAGNLHNIIRLTENLGQPVSSKNLSIVVERFTKGYQQGKPKFNEYYVSLIKQVNIELGKLKVINNLLKNKKGDESLKKAVEQMFDLNALNELALAVKAIPELSKNNKEYQELIALKNEVNALMRENISSKVTTTGSRIDVFISDKNGFAKPIKAYYKVVDADEIIASHDPISFQKRKEYPEGVQERVYHRDKTEQSKVIMNAQNFKPAIVFNTNPDAVNGTPLVTEEGYVLGGNSRTMSLQRIYKELPDKAKEVKEYIAKNINQFGITDKALKKIKNPVVVRVVPDVKKEDMKNLVRKFNESFTQGIDPRTMQVALANKINNEILMKINSLLESGDTINSALSKRKSKSLIKSLQNVGIIDNRNYSMYISPKTGLLNEDGKEFVVRLLVGHIIPSGDVLSETPKATMNMLAKIASYVSAIKVENKEYDISGDLRQAVEAYNEIKMKGIHKQDYLGQTSLFAYGAVGELPPITKNPIALKLLDMLEENKPLKTTKFFKEYLKQVKYNPANQNDLFGNKPTKKDLFDRSYQIYKKSITEGKMNGILSLMKSLNKALKNDKIKNVHKSPPKRYKEEGATKPEHYADPDNFKYPIYATDKTIREKRIRAAIAYFCKPKNYGMYSPEYRKKIANRILEAAEKEGIEVGESLKELAGKNVEKGFGLKNLTKRLLKSKKEEISDEMIKQIMEYLIKLKMKRDWMWEKYINEYDIDTNQYKEIDVSLRDVVESFVDEQAEDILSNVRYDEGTNRSFYVRFVNLFDSVDKLREWVKEIVFSNLNKIPDKMLDNLSESSNQEKQYIHYVRIDKE